MHDQQIATQSASSRRIGRHVTGALATLAMGSWVVLAAIPMIVAIMALT